MKTFFFFFFFFGDRLKNFCEDLFFFFFWRALALCVLGPWPWPRAFLSLASRVSVLGKAVLGLGFFLCPWPWPRALCPRLHLWQNSPKGYFTTSAKIALSLILTQTLTLTLIPTLAQTLIQTQTEEKHYFASRGKQQNSPMLFCHLEVK